MLNIVLLTFLKLQESWGVIQCFVCEECVSRASKASFIIYSGHEMIER